MESPDTTQFRHNLIQKEFRDILSKNEYRLPLKTDGVVVLSGPAVKDNGGHVVSYDSPETRSRVEFGVELIKQIVTAKDGLIPALILNGVTEQLSTLKRIALEAGFPENKIELVDSGKDGTANTKTQFEVMNKNTLYQKTKHLTFVTSSWHAPRVLRTAEANLSKNIDFSVIPVPSGRAPFDVFKIVRGEVRRIESYSTKGDISR
jgi:uncharacterized SAM-binding protein YcdF (DUF218 family)